MILWLRMYIIFFGGIIANRLIFEEFDVASRRLRQRTAEERPGAFGLNSGMDKNYVLCPSVYIRYLRVAFSWLENPPPRL